MFNLIEALQELKNHRSLVERKIERLDFAIDALSHIDGTKNRHPRKLHLVKRRGNRVWSKAQRKAAAARMKKRWKNGDFDHKRKAA